MKHKTANIRLIGRNLLLIVLSFIIAILITEVTMRLIGKINNINFKLYMKELKNPDRLPKSLFLPHDSLLYVLKPSTQALATTSDFSVIYKINSHGLRDKEYSYKKPDDMIRILAFGDSLTFGEGIPYGKRFTDIVDNYFPNIEIINCGVPGYALDQILVYFVCEGLKYNPDYVILFLNTDILERYSFDIIKDDSVVLDSPKSFNAPHSFSTLFLEKDDPFFDATPSSILHHSYFLSYLKYKITLLQLKRQMQQHDKNFWNEKDIPLLPPNRIKAGIDKHKRARLLFAKLSEITRNKGIQLIVIKIDYYGDLSYLKDLLDQCHIFIDLTEDIQAEGKHYPLQFTYDPHYNKQTHAFIGKKVIHILNEVIASQ